MNPELKCKMSNYRTFRKNIREIFGIQGEAKSSKTWHQKHDLYKIKNKLNFIEIKSFTLWKTQVRGWKTSYRLRENICKPHIWTKALVSRIWKEFSKLKRKEANVHLEHQQKHGKNFHQIIYWWQISTLKDVQLY